MYVADSSNQRIRKVDTYGTVSTIAGSSMGDSDGEDAMLARFNFPTGITVSQMPPPKPGLAPVLYFTDSFSNRVRALHNHWYDQQRVVLPGTPKPPAFNCTTVAGSIPGYLDGYGNRSNLFVPAGIVLSNSGVLYFADSSNNVVRKLQKGAQMQHPMCKAQSGSCGIKRQCRDLSGALCAYREDPCLDDNKCLCDVLFHNATCNEMVYVSRASRSISESWCGAAVVAALLSLWQLYVTL